MAAFRAHKDNLFLAVFGTQRNDGSRKEGCRTSDVAGTGSSGAERVAQCATAVETREVGTASRASRIKLWCFKTSKQVESVVTSWSVAPF